MFGKYPFNSLKSCVFNSNLIHYEMLICYLEKCIKIR